MRLLYDFSIDESDVNMYYPKKPHPTFLVTVKSDRLVTNGDWFRSVTMSNCFGFLLINTMPRLNYFWRRKFRKPLYVVDDDGREEKYLEDGDVTLAINAETILAQNVVECLLVDHTEIIISD